MRREVIDDITLSDGTRLRKGSEFMVSAMSHWDPSLYTNPEEWDGMRFYRLRQQQGNENASQAVITSAEHLVSPPPSSSLLSPVSTSSPPPRCIGSQD